MFLVKPFSVRKFLNGYGLGGASAGNGYVSFLWHALAFLDMKAMPNKHTLTFNCGQVEGHPIDGGGHSYYYIKNNPDVQIRYVNHFYSGNFHCDSCKSTNQQLCTHNTEKLMTEGFDNNQLLFLQSACNVEFFHNNSFLHYRGGTNWDNQSQKYHQMKTAALNTYLAAILEETYAKQN